MALCAASGVWRWGLKGREREGSLVVGVVSTETVTRSLESEQDVQGWCMDEARTGSRTETRLWSFRLKQARQLGSLSS